MQTLEVIDTHTGGEPTRIVFSGGPDLGNRSMTDRVQRFREEFDRFRTAIVNEPRGSEVWVGALLCEPTDPACAAGVIFFNNVGYLGMCGHGTMGVAVALGWLGRISAGTHRLETPVGIVSFDYDGAENVRIENVPSYRLQERVAVDVPGHGVVTGDVAWGGNWFFLCEDHGQTLELQQAAALTDFTWRIRRALQANGITGGDGAEIDHIELFGPPADLQNHSRNFVHCPGGAYDRSPCGTGTSAKIACLAAAGKLAPEQDWRQESIIGSVFTGSYRQAGEQVVPTVRGTAWVTAQATLVIHPDDPLAWGIG